MAKDNKREMLILALESLLPGRRFHEITLEEVAKVAGVGKGTIYLYFKDKDDLFSEMFFYCFERLSQKIAALRNPDGTASLEEQLRKMAALIETFMLKHHAGFGAFSDLAAHIARMSQKQLDTARELHAALIRNIAQVLEDTGELSPTRTIQCATMFHWMMRGYVQSRLHCGEESMMPDLEYSLRCFLYGVKHVGCEDAEAQL